METQTLKNVGYGLGGLAVLGLLFSTRRRIETRPHLVNDFGYVEASPRGLADLAGVPLDQYVLASAMASEEKTDKARLAVGRAIWNAVRGNRRGLVPKLIPTGVLGSQTVNPYAATSKPPTQRVLALAAAIMEGRVPDFVHGATQWDAPKTQDKNYQLYLKDPVTYAKYRFNSEMIAARRKAKGAREVNVPGVPDTRFWSYT